MLHGWRLEVFLGFFFFILPGSASGPLSSVGGGLLRGICFFSCPSFTIRDFEPASVVSRWRVGRFQPKCLEYCSLARLPTGGDGRRS